MDTTHAPYLMKLQGIASTARSVFESILTKSLGHQDTNGTCLYAAILCSTMISQFTQGIARVRGGDGENDGGLFIDGRGHGHYWIEVTHESSTYIIDIAADQFGLAPLIVAEGNQLPAVYRPGCQATVDDHVRELTALIKTAAHTTFDAQRHALV